MAKLKKRVIKGIRWTAISNITITSVQFLKVTVLTNYLTPEDFGIFAIINLMLSVSVMFTDAGISKVIIWKQNLKNNQLSTLYWMNIIAGVMIYLVIFILSPVIAEIYEKTNLISYIKVAGMVILVNSFSKQYYFHLQKELKFKIIGIVEISSAIVSFIIAIILAINGYGIYALILSALVFQILRTILFFFAGWELFRPALIFSLASIKEISAFGKYQVGEKILIYLASEIDTILISKLIGFHELGLYSISKRLLKLPYRVINPITNRVAFPLMAQLQNDEIKFDNLVKKIQKTLSSLNFPVYIFIIIFAGPIVNILFGSEWGGATILIQILSVAYLMRSKRNPVGNFLLAKGLAKKSFKWNLFNTIFAMLVIVIGSFWGIIGICISYCSWELMLHVIEYRFVISKVTKISFKDYSFLFLRPIIFALLGVFIAKSILIYLNITEEHTQIFIAALIILILNLFDKSFRENGLAFFGN